MAADSKKLFIVIPAQAGIQDNRTSPTLGPCFRWDDGNN